MQNDVDVLSSRMHHVMQESVSVSMPAVLVDVIVVLYKSVAAKTNVGKERVPVVLAHRVLSSRAVAVIAVTSSVMTAASVRRAVLAAMILTDMRISIPMAMMMVVTGIGMTILIAAIIHTAILIVVAVLVKRKMILARKRNMITARNNKAFHFV